MMSEKKKNYHEVQMNKVFKSSFNIEQEYVMANCTSQLE